ncbi:Protein prrc1 [Halocaridina rubra]|uniref:Protein prrc1 n=1 Tax=Halocaridina rubra TaxID=373956 RepID=A0AAN8X9G6_HALRR
MMQEDSNGDFEIVDKKMATLLATDSAGGGKSVLTNVAPPSALPSFLASPLPASSSIAPPAPIPVSPAVTGSYKVPGGNIVRSPGGTPIPSAVPSPGVTPPLAPPAVPSGSPSSISPPVMTPPSSNQSSTFPPSHPVTSQPPASPFVPESTPSVNITSHLQSPSSSVDASVDLGSPGVGGGPPKPGWFGWIRGTVSNVSHKVAEKAKSSMDTMITTLDPQMKEFIHSGGDMDIVVASDKEVKVGAVREAFQHIFGKATVVGMAAQSGTVAAQPVGFAAALHSAEERINSLRASGRVHPQQPVVSVENFIVELTPDCWYDMGLLLLDDPGEDIILQTYTQVTPIPPEFVAKARTSTPDDYPLKDSGYAITVGQIASEALQIHHSMWQETLTGVPRRDLIVLAARTLAGLYKSRLPLSRH